VTRDSSAIWKFGVFAVVSMVIAVYLGMVLAHYDPRPQHGYTAIFTNASNLKTGAPVRVAGVDVGRVDNVAINDGGRGTSAVRVKFHIYSDIQLTSNVTATIRFKNLIGDQYLELDSGAPSSKDLAAGATIPPSRTKAALDLDALFNGFQPLFQGLDTGQINELSSAVVNVLQGQAGAVYQLIASLSSLFTTLAQNDELIGNVVDNLDTALGAVSAHAGDLSGLIKQLQQLVTGLAADRKPIGASLVNINALAASASILLDRSRPALRTDIPALDAVATTLNKNTDTLQFILSKLPATYDGLIRTGSFGGFFNFFICGLRLKVTGPTGPLYTPWTYSNLQRCKTE
jgi:phospholipid/cholesterol/gamma-HCH transport system substrate-binding protein